MLRGGDVEELREVVLHFVELLSDSAEVVELHLEGLRHRSDLHLEVDVAAPVSDNGFLRDDDSLAVELKREICSCLWLNSSYAYLRHLELHQREDDGLQVVVD